MQRTDCSDRQFEFLSRSLLAIKLPTGLLEEVRMCLIRRLARQTRMGSFSIAEGEGIARVSVDFGSSSTGSSSRAIVTYDQLSHPLFRRTSCRIPQHHLVEARAPRCCFVNKVTRWKLVYGRQKYVDSDIYLPSATIKMITHGLKYLRLRVKSSRYVIRRRACRQRDRRVPIRIQAEDGFSGYSHVHRLCCTTPADRATR